MIVRFWGTRGSIPAPGPGTARYGGNTTCIEIDLGQGPRIILDAGTGIRPLGLTLAKAMPVECHVFITHTHWDHIQGLPFFVPLFVPGNRVTIYGPPNPLAQTGIEEVLPVQMAYPYFPVRAAELRAGIEAVTLSDGQTVQAGAANISALLMNHPALCYGYLVEFGGARMFFTGDHEPFANIYAPDDEEWGDYQQVVDERNAAIRRRLTGVDLLVVDAQYTDEEYEARRGWGHGSFGQAMALARGAGVRRVVCTHHDPTRDDAALDALMARVAAEHPDLDICAAREGMEIDLGR
ncbi:MAG: MBL fold metallo-hydrolase [Desulfovibrionaceae bacterium]